MWFLISALQNGFFFTFIPPHECIIEDAQRMLYTKYSSHIVS